MADVEQTQKMIPFITCEISLCQNVCELFCKSGKLHKMGASALCTVDDASCFSHDPTRAQDVCV